MLNKGLYDKAQIEWDKVMIPFGKFSAKTLAINGGEGKIEKAMSEIMGLPMGPPRPPSLPLNDNEMAELKSLMTSWGWPVP